MDSLICIKITTIIGQEINMKRDLYRFTKPKINVEANEINSVLIA